MKLSYTPALCLMVSMLANTAQARPVSYPGGVTAMQMNDMNSHSIHLHYSPTAKYSIGYKGEYFKDKDWHLHAVQINYLVKRWNKPSEQANLYLKGGIGLAYSNYQSFNGEASAAGTIGIAADWETRRWFASYENRYVNAGNIEELFNQKARIGVAPYIGDYGDLHTWLMLQVDHNPSQDDKVTFTPLVRLFKGEYLAEAGVSDKGDVLFNLVARF